MRIRVFNTALATAIATAGIAEAACEIDSAGLVERHASLDAERGTLTDEARQALGELRRTAEMLDRNGFEAICGEVVGSARRLLEKETAWTAEDPPVGDPARAVGALNLVTFAATDRPVETVGLIGRPVHSTDGAVLGRVEDVLLDQSRDASHVILSNAGLWSSRGHIVAVPSARLLVEPSTDRLFAEIPATALAEAPAYDRSGPWRPAANDAWYDERAAEAVAAAAERTAEKRSSEQRAADAAQAKAREEGVRPEEAPAVAVQDGPKRIRVEKDRPERAVGSND